MIPAKVAKLDQFTAPYGKEVSLENVTYENGMRVLRVHIREGNRFTVMDIDARTASRWAAAMGDWAGELQDSKAEKE
ncbi:MAG: hypothetical protein KJN61_08870 [Gammaproteobacteria bacterium]|nr:hypothetical protein [Gammaproteobacteria bacterium]MBT8076568.1 hypothetical protein [Gammaproteobacteria bacterium]NNL00215.1 hypothetical protein [Xanthomonadales bacterium]